jgi:sterol desaturase/sphingolipid hydroxylase (fatty acid hydroxylase superfamily)
MTGSGQGWRSLGIFLVGLTLWGFERASPLRRSVESPKKRDLRNLAMAGISGILLHITERPLANVATQWTVSHRAGLLFRLPFPERARSLLTFFMLDYTLYLWHILTHRLPFLWRMHAVHHLDRDLTATTAIRFHAAELVISSFWRVAQIVLIGVTPRRLSQWQTLTLMSVLFHHSNVRLPLWLERRLVLAIVTPRMHGIHHSIVQGETDSNWSRGLALWDRLHGTLRLDVHQDRITIGAPGYDRREGGGLPRLLLAPWREA